MRLTRWWYLLVVGLSLAGCGVGPEPDDDDSGAGDDTEPDDPWFCAPEPSSSELPGGGWLVETEHYELTIWLDRDEAETIGRLIEASWEAQGAWFGATPELGADERLVVELHATVADWEASIAADGLAVPFGAGGYYHSGTGKAYLFRQPTVWYTRVLTVHEVAHQFHDRARTHGAGTPGWYVEGIAEYLALHDWDGECVRLGRLPMLSVEDIPRQARDQAVEGADLDGLIGADVGMTRPLSWAIVRYFDRAEGGLYSEDWRAFRDVMDAGGADAAVEFTEAMGEEPAAFEDALVEWVMDEQQPMTPAFLEWIHVEPGSVDGNADAFSIAPVKEELSSFELRFEVPATEPWFGGVLYGWDDGSNWRAVGVGSDGQISTFEVAGGAVWWGQGTAPAPDDGGYRFVVEHDADVATVTINEQELVLGRPNAPAGGAALNASALSFSGIVWE